jgi:hypothetical protein
VRVAPAENAQRIGDRSLEVALVGMSRSEPVAERQFRPRQPPHPAPRFADQSSTRRTGPVIDGGSRGLFLSDAMDAANVFVELTGPLEAGSANRAAATPCCWPVLAGAEKDCLAETNIASLERFERVTIASSALMPPPSGRGVT